MGMNRSISWFILFCSITLTLSQSICGNGLMEIGEECDDGNLFNRDGCSVQCLLEDISHTFNGNTWLCTGAVGTKTSCCKTRLKPTYVGTTTSFSVAAGPNSNYIINGQSNPLLTLIKGSTYTFALNVEGHPFRIQTVSGGYDSSKVYTTPSLANNGGTAGNLVFTVPLNAPSNLYYVCENHESMHGSINIIDTLPTATLSKVCSCSGETAPYEGVYLSDDCTIKDLDECSVASTNGCIKNTVCKNLDALLRNGTHTCICPPG